MTDEARACGCNPHPHQDHKDHKDHKDRDDICDIKSVCCNGFFKEQFSLFSCAPGDGSTVTVYQTQPYCPIRGTVKVKNLSQKAVIRVDIDDLTFWVAPGAEIAGTACDIQYVSFSSQSPGCPAKALFCFDIAVPTCDLCCENPECCPLCPPPWTACNGSEPCEPTASPSKLSNPFREKDGNLFTVESTEEEE